MPTETIECPLCLGAGHLKRTEVLDRLGVKDFARVAQLSAEEAIRLLLSKHQQDEQSGWTRFEAELAKRTVELAQSHRDELHALTVRTKELESAARVVEQQKAHEIEHATRRVEDSLREVATLRERNHELECQMQKVARVGKREELEFAEEARTWPGICVSEKLPRNGDFTLAYRDPSGAVLEPCLLVDNKNKRMRSLKATSPNWCGMRRSVPSQSPFWSQGTKPSFGRWIKILAGIARTASGYCEPPGCGYPAISMS
jgi:hypothetical protein